METQTSVLDKQWIVGQQESAIMQIPASKIVITGNNDRKQFDPLKLQELADSIAHDGLAQYPTVRPLGDGSYELVAGERRTRAMRDVLQWELIPCAVREMSEQTASNIMLVENTGRVDLDPIEEAHGYQARIDKYGYSAAELAKIAGVRLSRVTERLALLSLTSDIQHLVSTKQFPNKYALTLAESKLDANRQRIALKAYNSAKYMNDYIWSDLLATLVEAQAAESQMSMFALETQVVDMAKARTAEDTKGPKARTGVKADRALPAVRRTEQDTLSAIFTRYISDLQSTGHSEAAGAIGNLLNVAVTMKWVSMEGSLSNLDGVAGEELHESVVSDTEAQQAIESPALPMAAQPDDTTSEFVTELYLAPMPAPRTGSNIVNYDGLYRKAYGWHGQRFERTLHRTYKADVLPGQWIRIYGYVQGWGQMSNGPDVYYYTPFDKTYSIGSTTKRGIVTDITSKTVTVRKAGAVKRLDLFTFTWGECES